MDILRTTDGSEAPWPLAWDTVWQGTDSLEGGVTGDWIVDRDVVDASGAVISSARAPGGFRGEQRLATAIVLCLMTDKRRPDWLDGDDGSEDPRGWFGDLFDLSADDGERELGSLLWTLRRAAPTFDTLRRAEHYAAEALQTIVDQGIVSRFDIVAAIDPKNPARMVLSVLAVDATDEQLFADTFPLY